MPSSKDTSKYTNIPKAVLETKPVVKVSKRGNKYTLWTPAWYNTMVRGQLREIFHQWPRRKEVLERVRVEKPKILKSGKLGKRPEVWYICELCSAQCKAAVSKKNPNNHKRIWVDHIEPVVPLEGQTSWDEYLERLFCDPSNLQAICDDCHKKKTKEERERRNTNSGKKPDWRR